MSRARLIPVMALLAGLACAQKSSAPEGAAQEAAGLRAPPGTFLAYEHDFDIELAAAAIPARLAEAQASCLAQRFGDCAVLGIEQSGGERPHAALTVRIAPAGVEPLVALAGEGGEVASRTTRAEDLAQGVQDNAAQRARLERELARLDAFAGRKDIAVSDLIALSKQIAETETQLEAARREAAQQQRRIDTNLVALRWRPPGVDAATSEISLALEEFGETFASGVAFVIYIAAYTIPAAVALAIPIAGLRWWRGRKRRAA
jgi:multidrug efflux pump subunit AcrA (membrane-fusion protein)